VESQLPSGKLTSRKFWLGASVMAAVLYLSVRMFHRLSVLLEGDHINESVFERLISVLINTDAMLLAFIVGLYWGINVWQQKIYAGESDK